MLNLKEDFPIWNQNFMQVIDSAFKDYDLKEMLKTIKPCFELENGWYCLKLMVTEGLKEDDIDISLDEENRTVTVITKGTKMGITFSTANRELLPDDVLMDTFEAILDGNKLCLMVKKR